MLYTLSLDPKEFMLLWQCIQKQPAEVVYALMKNLEAQVAAQEASSVANRQE